MAMKMMDRSVMERMDQLYQWAPEFTLSDSDRLVVVSDMHMGDGGPLDDFLRTSADFRRIFDSYYLENGYDLLLNGDVEELHKFGLRDIREKWSCIFDLFRDFDEGQSLYKIIGNHDLPLARSQEGDQLHRQFEAVRFRYMGETLFFLHGHQASRYLQRMNRVNGMLIRSLVKPMGIRNQELVLGRKGVTVKEYRLSRFSLDRGMLTFMGHTHRPLFSMDSGVPNLFNSGAAIGKQGITTIEIERGKISLVHWWSRAMVKRYLDPDLFDPVRLGGWDIYRVVLNTVDISDMNWFIRSGCAAC